MCVAPVSGSSSTSSSTSCLVASGDLSVSASPWKNVRPACTSSLGVDGFALRLLWLWVGVTLAFRFAAFLGVSPCPKPLFSAVSPSCSTALSSYSAASSSVSSSVNVPKSKLVTAVVLSYSPCGVLLSLARSALVFPPSLLVMVCARASLSSLLRVSSSFSARSSSSNTSISFVAEALSSIVSLPTICSCSSLSMGLSPVWVSAELPIVLFSSAIISSNSPCWAKMVSSPPSKTPSKREDLNFNLSSMSSSNVPADTRFITCMFRFCPRR